MNTVYIEKENIGKNKLKDENDLSKKKFNQMVATNQIDIRPDNTAYIDNSIYKIKPVKSTDKNVELEYVGEKLSKENK